MLTSILTRVSAGVRCESRNGAIVSIFPSNILDKLDIETVNVSTAFSDNVAKVAKEDVLTEIGGKRYAIKPIFIPQKKLIGCAKEC